jgi:hypothetical protein
MDKVQRSEILTLDFAKEVCSGFNDLCYKYKLSFEEETLILTDTETNKNTEVVAFDDMNLFRLNNGVAYIEFDADINGYNCCEINDFGIVLLRKLLLEYDKINKEGEFALANFEREQTLKASIMNSQLSARGCVPKGDMQTTSAMDQLPKQTLASQSSKYDMSKQCARDIMGEIPELKVYVDIPNLPDLKRYFRQK